MIRATEQEKNWVANTFLCMFPDTRFKALYDPENAPNREALNQKNGRIRASIPWDMQEDGYALYFTPNGMKGAKTGDHKAVSSLNAFWIDIDRKPYTQEDEQKDLELIQAFPIQPTFILRSKNGIHAHWCLSSTIYRETKTGEEWLYLTNRHTEIQNYLQIHFRSDPSVKNLSRVMRLPYSIHQKQPDDPFQVKVLLADTSTLTDFDLINEIALQWEKQHQATSRPAPRPEDSSIFFQKVNELYPIEDRPSTRALLSADPSLITEGTRNNALLATACLLRQAGRTEQEARSIIHPSYAGLSPEEVENTIHSAFSHEYTITPKFPIVKMAQTHEEREKLQDTYIKARKEVKDKHREQFLKYHTTFLKKHPFMLRATNEEVYDYNPKTGIYELVPDMIYSFISALQEEGMDEFTTAPFMRDLRKRTLADMKPVPLTPTPPNFVCVKNGVLDIETMELSKHSPNYYFFARSDIEYKADSVCPKFEAFVSQVMEEDMERVSILQEMAGYCTLSDSIDQQVAFFLYKESNSGKGTFMKTILSIMARESWTTSRFYDIFSRFGLGAIKNKRVVWCDDVDFSHEAKNGRGISLLRPFISGEITRIESKGINKQEEFTPITKYVFTCNDLPNYDETNRGNARRFIIIPFNLNFEKSKILNLDRIFIEEEGSGILNWCIAGLKRMQSQKGFTDSRVVSEDRETLAVENSSVLTFINDNFLIDNPSNCAAYKINDINAFYVAWCRRHGTTPKQFRAFSRDLGSAPNVLRARNKYGNSWETVINLRTRPSSSFLDYLEDPYHLKWKFGIDPTENDSDF
jgi:P4 family phage/plasmid primase-like protien